MEKTLPSSEKKHFARSQIIVRAINITYEDTKEILERALEAFEEVYEVQAKLSMAKMATIVHNLGLVMTKIKMQDEATSQAINIIVA
jgi:GTPase involved in cell partitioning and DNA repair